jgi:hypothetical protein
MFAGRPEGGEVRWVTSTDTVSLGKEVFAVGEMEVADPQVWGLCGGLKSLSPEYYV